MVRLESIKRQFGTRVLFDRLSWSIPRGARLGLVGPNGAGKTTVLRILDRRERPDEGSVNLPQSVRVGYLPQEIETLAGGRVVDVALSGLERVTELERKIREIERQLATAELDAAATARLTEQYGELRHRFEHLDGDRLEARAKAVLSGLGLPASSFERPLDELSGGWRMRVALARLLLASPDLLLLDEPTNHLDLEALGWLEEFLDAYEGAFVVVSHDRYFLNRVVDEIHELERGALTAFPGDYDTYLAAKEQRRAAREQAAKQQAREIKKVERFIERFRYKNTKARQVQSRVRALGKVERIRTDRTGKRVAFGFPVAPRSGDVVLRAESVAKRFDRHTVYEGLDLTLRRGDRVALVGPNGSGKSTLLKLAAGRLVPDEGRIELGHNVRVRYYAQHQLDDLDAASTVLEELARAAPEQDRVWLRNLAGGFLFTGDEVDKRVAVLSGGEKARLALAKLLIRPANLLLLDEPTNHLDLRSREVLEEALNEYAGSLVVISHDRYFVNRIATSVGEIVGGTIEVVPGDYDEYVVWKARRAADAVVGECAPAADGAREGREARRHERREAKRREAAERDRKYRERRAAERVLEPIETEIAELERRQADLEQRQADPEVYADPERAAEVGRARAEVEARLERRYADWEVAAGGLPTTE